MSNVEKKVAEDFTNWRKETGRENLTRILEDMADYMEERFVPEHPMMPTVMTMITVSDIHVAQQVLINDDGKSDDNDDKKDDRHGDSENEDRLSIWRF